MKILSLSEFSQWAKHNECVIFCYDTREQAEGALRLCKIQARFDKVFVMFGPSRLCFQSANGNLCIDNVDSVSVCRNADGSREIIVNSRGRFPELSARHFKLSLDVCK